MYGQDAGRFQFIGCSHGSDHLSIQAPMSHPFGKGLWTADESFNVRQCLFRTAQVQFMYARCIGVSVLSGYAPLGYHPQAKRRIGHDACTGSGLATQQHCDILGAGLPSSSVFQPTILVRDRSQNQQDSSLHHRSIVLRLFILLSVARVTTNSIASPCEKLIHYHSVLVVKPILT